MDIMDGLSMSKDQSAISTPETSLLHLSGSEIQWNRAEILRSLEGKTIQRVQFGQTGAFLEVSDIGILSLNLLLDKRTGRPFLFWELSD
jgi:hypothetical protein